MNSFVECFERDLRASAETRAIKALLARRALPHFSAADALRPEISRELMQAGIAWALLVQREGSAACSRGHLGSIRGQRGHSGMQLCLAYASAPEMNSRARGSICLRVALTSACENSREPNGSPAAPAVWAARSMP
eukprot:Amastigsp_a511734_8.p5 type:complete len:136 gc:universal Amastigsp_a511734_8:283-690(+)